MATRSSWPAASSPPRTGFTLVELLIALVLLNVGLFALVALGAAISRDANGARALSIATAAATARLERMASAYCTAGTNAIATVNPAVTEWFAESKAPNDTRILSDSVRIVASRGTRTVVVRTRARC